MNKLTRQQRHIFYILMLAEAEDHKKQELPELWSEINGGYYPSSHWGLCFTLMLVFDLVDPFRDFKELFPELYAKKKPCGLSYFWDTWNERVEALRQCVEETA
jgi:hypothetical protein